MAYAFSRDGAMPFSSLWHKVNKQEVPINAVWCSAFISFCMALTVSMLLMNLYSLIYIHSSTIVEHANCKLVSLEWFAVSGQ